jgi:hypothetical protein
MALEMYSVSLFYILAGGRCAGESPLRAKACEIGVRSGTTEAPLGTGQCPE